MTIRAADCTIEIYQTERQQADGLVAYYRGLEDRDALLRLGKTLRIVVEQVISEIIMVELRLDTLPEDRRITHRLEPD